MLSLSACEQIKRQFVSEHFPIHSPGSIRNRRRHNLLSTWVRQAASDNKIVFDISEKATID